MLCVTQQPSPPGCRCWLLHREMKFFSHDIEILKYWFLKHIFLVDDAVAYRCVLPDFGLRALVGDTLLSQSISPLRCINGRLRIVESPSF